ncbi:MAG: T9SS type A sorting domain-containing protein [Lewinellaceae bacterium]|nr:T9SS type A sorting domain-containing protein [Saprospiraceae bacterium]MCB9338208.1 T9SS type A sorting domain-containing protein [Lewinellaceae bacterium]
MSGEILVKKTGDKTVEATIVTYTKESSIAADRDSLTICWGDGSCDVIPRINGSGEPLGFDIKRNIYISTHAYLENNSYLISMTDPNRNGGILNINAPFSENVEFHIQTFIKLSDQPLSTPVLLELPVDIAIAGQPYIHVPNAYDENGDSISYQLVTPMDDIDSPVPNYLQVTEIGPGIMNNISIDAETGEIIWDAPQIAGLYVIAISIKSWRNGVLVEEVIRDMQISVTDGLDSPPDISMSVGEGIVDVVVGDTVEVAISVEDINLGQTFEITSTSGLYSFFQNPATFSSNVNGNSGSAIFHWIVANEHVRQQPYQVVFKAKDNWEMFGQANFKIARFRVVSLTSADGLAPAFEGSIFPNPVSRWLSIQSPQTSSDKLQLEIFDMAGKQLTSSGIHNGKTSRVDMANLATGTYLVRILDHGKCTRTEKIIKY